MRRNGVCASLINLTSIKSIFTFTLKRESHVSAFSDVIFFSKPKFQVCNGKTLHNQVGKSNNQSINQPTQLLYYFLFGIGQKGFALSNTYSNVCFAKTHGISACTWVFLAAGRQLVATVILFCNETMNGWTKWWCFWGNAH